ncbi:MAG: tetratricopeptide repeat protein [Bryobacteraceae bacterium]
MNPGARPLVILAVLLAGAFVLWARSRFLRVGSFSRLLRRAEAEAFTGDLDRAAGALDAATAQLRHLHRSFRAAASRALTVLRANLLYRRGDLDAAASLTYELLARTHAAPNPDPYAVAQRYSDLGRICMAREDYGEASALFEKSLQWKLGAGCHEIDHVPELLMLARALARQGRLPDACMAMARSAAIERRALADPSLDRHPALLCFGADLELQPAVVDEWLLYQGEYERAAAGFRSKIACEGDSGVALDLEGLPYQEKLAEAEEGLGRHGPARDAFLEAAAVWELRLAPGHPRAAWCRRRAAEISEITEAGAAPDGGISS